MEKKKHHNPEKNRTLNFQVGLVVVLSLLLVAFNWNTKQRKLADLGTIMAVSLEDDMIQTRHKEKIKPPPPPKKRPGVTVLEIIDNSEKETIGDIGTEFEPDLGMESTKINIAPEKEDNEDNIPIILAPSEPAMFKGGLAAMRTFLQKNLQYPKDAKIYEIEGKVSLRFTVDPNGRISDIEVLRSPDPILSQEAIRVVKSMPDWKPAKQAGRKVYTRLSIPINFKLN